MVATRLGVTDLPSGVRSTHLAGVAAAAGTGFTVSLFVAEVAFGRDGPLLAPVRPAAGRVGGLGDPGTPRVASGGAGLERGGGATTTGT